MLSHFESEISKLEEEIRAREAQKAQEQLQADAICRDLRGKFNDLLEKEKGKIQKRRIGTAILEALSGGWMGMPEHLDPDELAKSWETTKTVDLGEERPLKVDIRAYGGKSPLQSSRTFIMVVGSSRMIELGNLSIGGVTWHLNGNREGTSFGLRRGGSTGLTTATFFQDVYQKLAEQSR